MTSQMTSNDVHLPDRTLSGATSAMRTLELQIARRLLRRPRTEDAAVSDTARVTRWGDRLIAVLAVTVSLVVVGSVLEELVWVVIAAGTIFALGMDG